MYDNDGPDYEKLNRIGGWLLLFIARLAFQTVSAVIATVTAPELGYAGYIPLFLTMAGAAIATVVLLFMKKKAFRYTYYAFSACCLVDYFIAQNAPAFVGCMVVEAAWILYLLTSVRVKLILGIIKPEN